MYARVIRVQREKCETYKFLFNIDTCELHSLFSQEILHALAIFSLNLLV